MWCTQALWCTLCCTRQLWCTGVRRRCGARRRCGVHRRCGAQGCCGVPRQAPRCTQALWCTRAPWCTQAVWCRSPPTCCSYLSSVIPKHSQTPPARNVTLLAPCPPPQITPFIARALKNMLNSHPLLFAAIALPVSPRRLLLKGGIVSSCRANFNVSLLTTEKYHAGQPCSAKSCCKSGEG